MTRRRMTYLLWRDGKLPGHRPGFAELHWFAQDNGQQ